MTMLISMPFVQNAAYDFKAFFNNESASERNEIHSQMDLTGKTEETGGELSDNQNEMILDTVSTSFGLTPMETEDNQADLENLTDSMAMQVERSLGIFRLSPGILRSTAFMTIPLRIWISLTTWRTIPIWTGEVGSFILYVFG